MKPIQQLQPTETLNVHPAVQAELLGLKRHFQGQGTQGQLCPLLSKRPCIRLFQTHSPGPNHPHMAFVFQTLY